MDESKIEFQCCDCMGRVYGKRALLLAADQCRVEGCPLKDDAEKYRSANDFCDHKWVM